MGSPRQNGLEKIHRGQSRGSRFLCAAATSCELNVPFPSWVPAVCTRQPQRPRSNLTIAERRVKLWRLKPRQLENYCSCLAAESSAGPLNKWLRKVPSGCRRQQSESRLSRRQQCGLAWCLVCRIECFDNWSTTDELTSAMDAALRASATMPRRAHECGQSQQTLPQQKTLCTEERVYALKQ